MRSFSASPRGHREPLAATPRAAARSAHPPREHQPAAAPTPVFDTLRRCSDRLDRLMRDVAAGTGSHRQHEDHVDRAERIAEDLRAAFRGRGPAVNPPLRINGGQGWW